MAGERLVEVRIVTSRHLSGEVRTTQHVGERWVLLDIPLGPVSRANQKDLALGSGEYLLCPLSTVREQTLLATGRQTIRTRRTRT